MRELAGACSADLVAGRLRELGWHVAVREDVVAVAGGPVRAVVVAAIDDAAGVAVLLELARLLRGVPGVLLVAAKAGALLPSEGVRLVLSLEPRGSGVAELQRAADEALAAVLGAL
jgi:hypothetical protein